ncbi:dihydroorotase [Acidithiobacillus sp. IBUN Pt1247-S3]|uniref:dihydroorotase n=1 Tax=Acidithiobacillus sp. IBUN Pt1247-S3 TaxID=3166642 RepID=UPI0034E5994C
MSSITTQEISILRPDDWHLHLRDGAMLHTVLPDTAVRFGRAIVMPNLKPPVSSAAMAQAYRERILAALPKGSVFTPLMTLYLTEATPIEAIRAAKESGIVHAVKYYPAGATTNSENGVRDLKKVYPVLAAMEHWDLPLLLHGEVTDPVVDVFDREAVFIERHLIALRRDFPALRMVLEHVTTSAAVDFVQSAGARTAATITAHHLLLNRNAMFQGGIRPHHYCLPILKRERHREALVQAAISGNPQFFLGTDSAPHPQNAKESACGCAGIYTAHAAIELYAEVFAKANALDRLEAFASRHGPAFYGLPCNTDSITLRHESWCVPEKIGMGAEMIVPLRAGEEISWRLVGVG